MGAIIFKQNKYGGNTDVTDGNHIVVDNGSGSNVTAQQMYNNILSDISTVETTSTASKNYAVDEHLIYNGLLYKVTATIAQGDTLVVGTNITRVNITDQLSDSDDSVVEYSSYSAFPATGESGKIYIDISTNNVYRWDGTEYVGISSSSSGSVRELTQAQYNALTEAEKKNGTIYLITDSQGNVLADDVVYDNTDSTLTSTNVQDAITELSTTSSGIVSLTQAQYNALTSEQKNNGTVYMITDGTDGWLASDSVYINTTSGLIATNVQDAIDELVSSANLPSVTASDNGKILQVVNGQWTAVTIPSANGVSF